MEMVIESASVGEMERKANTHRDTRPIMLHSQNTSAVTTPTGALCPWSDRQTAKETETLRAPETKLVVLSLGEEERLSDRED